MRVIRRKIGALAWGARGRQFESARPDQFKSKRIEFFEGSPAEFAILLQSFGKPPQVLIERRRIIPKRPVSRGGHHLNLRMGQTGFVLIDGS